ncbi:unnamed protein product, partial [Ranitomeya imitator]
MELSVVAAGQTASIQALLNSLALTGVATEHDVQALDLCLRFCEQGHGLAETSLVFTIVEFGVRLFEDPEHLHREKRQKAPPDPNKNTCKMLVVADHRFYKYMGRKEESTTINYLARLLRYVASLFYKKGLLTRGVKLHSSRAANRSCFQDFLSIAQIELIDRVDDIYRNTSWDSQWKGYGVQIEQIIVHKEPENVTGSKLHYNMAKNYPNENKDAWDVKQLLEQFSHDISDKASTVCLAHLFTYQDFDMGTLGLAYVGSHKPNTHGGICPKAYRSESSQKSIFLNTGLTSTKNYGKTILTKEADLVTTHELGHNFGSEHDPDSMQDCAPNEDHGGKFVMYPIAVSGDHQNNKMFSACSRESILRTLMNKASICFKERNNKVCGNSRVDEGEDCDPGLLHQHDDPCCTSVCKFKNNAECSDRNSPCCKNCQFETAQKKCQEAINATCKGESYCTGNSSECPAPGNAANDTVCVDLGKCMNGECRPFCEIEMDLKSCACNETEHSCKVCCRNSDGTCSPYTDASKQNRLLRKGKPCTVGFCDGNGKCEKQVQDVIERIWDFIDKLSINMLGKKIYIVIVYILKNETKAKFADVNVWAPCMPIGRAHGGSAAGCQLLIAADIRHYVPGAVTDRPRHINPWHTAIKDDRDVPAVQGSTAQGGGSLRASLRPPEQRDVIALLRGSHLPPCSLQPRIQDGRGSGSCREGGGFTEPAQSRHCEACSAAYQISDLTECCANCQITDM